MWLMGRCNTYPSQAARSDGRGGSSVVGKNQSLAANYQPLIVNHEVVSSPSARRWRFTHGMAGRQTRSKDVAVIADPVLITQM